MSWDAAKSHMDDYRKKRVQALNNEIKQKWFTTPLGSVSELFTDKFNRDDENNAWRSEYTGDRGRSDADRYGDVKKLQNWRIRIASMCSSARDLRSQFAAWRDHRVRVPLDWDRFEYERVGFNFTKLDNLDQILKDKEGGLAAL
jgi:hypothetical protein